MQRDVKSIYTTYYYHVTCVLDYVVTLKPCKCTGVGVTERDATVSISAYKGYDDTIEDQHMLYKACSPRHDALLIR